MKNKIYKKQKNSEKISNDVMRNGILLGCHQGLTVNDLNYICVKFEKFALNKKL
jgi:CDP-6-deoxy-D-xylo-4-hexulose-3-dehydrase